MMNLWVPHATGSSPQYGLVHLEVSKTMMRRSKRRWHDDV